MGLSFKKADHSDIPKLKKLWAVTFNEKQQAVDLFFNKNFENLSAYCVYNGNLTVSALYLVHGYLNGQKAHYLCGASTLQLYRKRGIMGKLIEYALYDARKNGDVYSLLFPANDKLYSFYGRFGYIADCTAKRLSISRRQLESLEYDGINSDLPYDYEQLQLKCFKKDFLLQNNKFVEFAAEYYAFYGVKAVRGKGCFALYEDYDDCADVFYSAYADFSELKTLLLKSTNARRFVFTGKADNGVFKDSKTQKFGMIKSLDGCHKIPQDVFIGITLN